MRAGKLRQRVELQDRTVTQGSYGEAQVTYSTLDTVWAAVEPLQGREFIEGQQLQAEVTTRIRIRYRDGIAPEMRVVHGTHTYDIVSVIEPATARRELHLMCSEVL